MQISVLVSVHSERTLEPMLHSEEFPAPDSVISLASQHLETTFSIGRETSSVLPTDSSITFSVVPPLLPGNILDLSGNVVGTAANVAGNVLSGGVGLGNSNGVLDSGMLQNVGGTVENAAGQTFGSVSDLTNQLASSNVVNLNALANSGAQGGLSANVDGSVSGAVSPMSGAVNGAVTVNGVVNSVGSTAGGIAGTVGGGLTEGANGGASTNPISVANNLVNAIPNTISTGSNVLGSGESNSGGLLSEVNSVVSPIVSGATSAAQNIAAGVGGALTAAGNTISSSVSPIVNSITTGVGNALGSLGGSSAAGSQGTTNLGTNLAANVDASAGANAASNTGPNVGGTTSSAPTSGGILSTLGGLIRLFVKRQQVNDSAQVNPTANLTPSLGLAQTVGSGSNVIQAGTTLATTVSIEISLTAIPAQGTTISTAAAIAFSISPTTSSSSLVPITSPTAVPSAVNSVLPAPPGMCILFFAPFTGNLTTCPAGKVSLQYPIVTLGSNRYGGLGPCAQYPNNVVPILDQQFGPIGL